jgi:hypothetical protein
MNDVGQREPRIKLEEHGKPCLVHQGSLGVRRAIGDSGVAMSRGRVGRIGSLGALRWSLAGAYRRSACDLVAIGGKADAC